LKQAREKRDTAKKQVSDGIDPCAIKKEEKITKDHTFEKVTRDWFASGTHTVREITQQKKMRRFERLVFPVIGNMIHAEIKSPDIYKIIKPIIAKRQLRTGYIVRSARHLPMQLLTVLPTMILHKQWLVKYLLKRLSIEQHLPSLKRWHNC